MRARWVAAALALILGACATGTVAGPAATPDRTPEPATSPGPPPIAIVLSRYGRFEIKTQPGDACEVAIRVNSGTFGDGPPRSLTGTADAAGAVAWTYPSPLVPSGLGSHTVTCRGARGAADGFAQFGVTPSSLDAKGFTTRVVAVDPLAGLEGVTAKLEPSLVPVRDAAVARLNETLANEWKTATRGLGALTLVESSADIVIYVLPGRSSSLHVTAGDGTQRILLYVVDELGTVSPENLVATALHELGHIWCCRGADAGTDGHWLEKLPDPLLRGVDQYGLMTHPVSCLVRPGLQSCPNRFSERELRAMGFTEVPPPPPDACITQATALRSQLTALDATLTQARVAIDALKAEIADLARQIAAIEATYPGRSLPPDVYATYIALIDQHNAKLADHNARVATFNRDVDTRNSLAQRLNALPC